MQHEAVSMRGQLCICCERGFQNSLKSRGATFTGDGVLKDHADASERSGRLFGIFNQLNLGPWGHHRVCRQSV